MRRTITVALAALAAATAAVLSGCTPAAPLSYAPAAYGVAGHCYYVDTPVEVTALWDAGLCPRSWVATPMPMAWEEEYYDYYDSPAYYGTYIPARMRTVYVSRERTFYSAHRTTIVTLSRSATYRSSRGGTVKGTAVRGTTRFGSGTSFGTSGQKYGGGSLRSRGTSGSSSQVSTSSRSRSSGYGGGSLRSRGH